MTENNISFFIKKIIIQFTFDHQQSNMSDSSAFNLSQLSSEVSQIENRQLGKYVGNLKLENLMSDI